MKGDLVAIPRLRGPPVVRARVLREDHNGVLVQVMRSGRILWWPRATYIRVALNGEG